MMKIDTHIHTSPASPCAIDDTRTMVDALIANGCDAIAITDHGFLDGYNEAVAMTDLLVIPAVEVSWYEPSTGFGADILLYAADPSIIGYIPEVMSCDISHVFPKAPREDWFATWAHPYGGGGIGGGTFDESIVRKMLSWVDAIEVWNGGCNAHNPVANAKALKLSRDYGFKCTAGSDAHEAKYAASAFITLREDAKTARDFIRLMRDGKYDIGTDARE